MNELIVNKEGINKIIFLEQIIIGFTISDFLLDYIVIDCYLVKLVKERKKKMIKLFTEF